MTSDRRPTKDALKAEIENAYSGTTVVKYGRGVIVLCAAPQAMAIEGYVLNRGLDVTGKTEGLSPEYARIYVFGFARAKKGATT